MADASSSSCADLLVRAEQFLGSEKHFTESPWILIRALSQALQEENDVVVKLLGIHDRNEVRFKELSQVLPQKDR